MENQETKIENIDSTISEEMVAKIVEKTVNATAEKFKKEDRTPVNSVGFLTDENENKVDKKVSFGNVQKSLQGLQKRTLDKFDVNIVTKAANETTTTAGGYVVEIEAGDEIINIKNQYGLARQICTIKPMNTYKRNFPKVSTGLVGYASVEGVALTGSQEVLSQVQLVTKDVSVIATSTAELLEDQSYPFTQELFTSAQTAIGLIEDQGMLIGWGNVWTGVVNASGIGTVTASATGALSSASLSATLGDSLADLISTVESANTNYDANGVYIMHPSVKNQIRKIKNTQGDYIFNQGNPAIGYPDTIFGKPVLVSNVMPDITNTTSGKKMIIYGDFKQVFMGLRKDVEVKFSDQGVVASDSLFEKNWVAYRFLERVDFAVARADAFAVLQLK